LKFHGCFDPAETGAEHHDALHDRRTPGQGVFPTLLVSGPCLGFSKIKKKKEVRAIGFWLVETGRG
ncbi:MAG TPA: hypothetical protein VKE24_08490, partial [Candidatus Acidoferrales bacterium]|nr:hypothetical protein [Candidatus Acidoferrales bacterium]